MRNSILLVSILVMASLFTGCSSSFQGLKDGFNRSLGKEEAKPVTKVRDEFSLRVNAPTGSTIKIMNIKPRFYQGIILKKGKYHVRVIKSGYRTYNKWIVLEDDRTLTVKLSKATKKSQSKAQESQTSDYDERPNMESSETSSSYDERPVTETTSNSYDEERPDMSSNSTTSSTSSDYDERPAN